MEFRNAYERDQHKGISFTDPVMTQQAYKEECDINTIIDRYTKTGVIPSDLVNTSAGVYGDFSEVGTFFDMQNRVLEARASFDALPSAIRDRFNNDPAELIAFVNNVDNYDEAVKLGIVKPKVVESVPAEKPETVPAEKPEGI